MGLLLALSAVALVVAASTGSWNVSAPPLPGSANTAAPRALVVVGYQYGAELYSHHGGNVCNKVAFRYLSPKANDSSSQNIAATSRRLLFAWGCIAGFVGEPLHPCDGIVLNALGVKPPVDLSVADVRRCSHGAVHRFS